MRFWNHIPHIRRTNDDGLDRYMVFNAGRFAACSKWFGGPAAFDRLLPTASAVGHDGADLVVHALAGNDPGIAVESPRQVPSYRYSRRFGPRPPCFARATVLNGSGDGRAFILVAVPADGNFEALRRFRDLRVYFVRERDRATVVGMVAAALPHLRNVEYVRADLCRPDLLVEIEGTAGI